MADSGRMTRFETEKEKTHRVGHRGRLGGTPPRNMKNNLCRVFRPDPTRISSICMNEGFGLDEDGGGECADGSIICIRIQLFFPPPSFLSVPL